MLLEAATKAIVYAALMPVIGAAATYWCVWLRLSGDARASGETMERSLRRVGLVASTLLVSGLLLRAWAHTAAAFGVRDAFSPEQLELMAIESAWGGHWQWQLAAAVATLASYVAVRPGRRTGWAVAGALGVATCLTLTLTGHAAGSPLRMALHTTHLVGAGMWLGTLSVVWWMGRTATGLRLALYRAFSAVALFAVGAVAAAGVVVAWLYVGVVSNLWTTGYGRTLVVKLTLVAAIVLCGFLNRRRVGRTGDGEAPSLAGVELTLTLAALIVTAVLTEVGHP